MEGEALAAVLLERLATTARLTYATTHHAGLKDLAAADRHFVNACVEFDVATLRPTYRSPFCPFGRMPFTHMPTSTSARCKVVLSLGKQMQLARVPLRPYIAALLRFTMYACRHEAGDEATSFGSKQGKHSDSAVPWIWVRLEQVAVGHGWPVQRAGSGGRPGLQPRRAT